jgi:hypothetical protein
MSTATPSKPPRFIRTLCILAGVVCFGSAVVSSSGRAFHIVMGLWAFAWAVGFDRQARANSASVQEWPPRQCPECHYDWSGLPSSVKKCPECGRRRDGVTPFR